MRKTIRRRYDAHVRVHDVCAEHSELFDATAGGKKTRATLGSQVAEVTHLLASQQRSVQDQRAALDDIRDARDALRNAAKGVVKVGRLVTVADARMSAMTPPGVRSDDELLAYTQGLLDRVSAHADAFVSEGLPLDLLQNLEDRMKAFVAAKSAFAAARQRYTAATHSILDTQAEADDTVGALEAIALNTSTADPDLLTRLRIAKRVGPRAEEPPAQPAPTTAPSPPTNKAA